MNIEFKLGFLAFIPLFIITLSFILSSQYFSEGILSKLKPVEYIGFISCAVGAPLYFYWRFKLTIRQMLFTIAYMWGTECIAYIFLAHWFVGLRKDMPYTLLNIIMVFGITFLIGYFSIGIVCLGGVVLRRVLSRIKTPAFTRTQK